MKQSEIREGAYIRLDYAQSTGHIVALMGRARNGGPYVIVDARWGSEGIVMSQTHTSIKLAPTAAERVAVKRALRHLQQRALDTSSH